MPNQKEMDEGIKNLAEHNNKVDFILTHCTASSTAALLSHGSYKPDKLTNYLEDVRCNVDYKRWLCGHYHDDGKLEASGSPFTSSLPEKSMIT